MSVFVIMMVRVYQWAVSPFLHSAVPVRTGCRFHPSCSAYLIEVIRTHGTFTGVRLGASRMRQCHSFGSMEVVKKT